MARRTDRDVRLRGYLCTTGVSMVYDERRLIAELRRQWVYVALIYISVLGMSYWILWRAWSTADALQWLLPAMLTMAVQMMVLWWALRFNHPPEGAALFPTLGVANGMTLTRGLLTCLMAGFLFAPTPQGWLAWAPALLYMSERIIDFFDGFVARYTSRETRLGAILDIEFDGLGVLIAVGLAIQYGHLPPWYLILGMARQLFILGIWLRRRLGKSVRELPPSDHRRLIAGFQTGFISIALWPIWRDEVALFAAWLFAVPLAFSFGRDWLAVSTVIDAESPRYRALRRRAKRLIEEQSPLVVRLLAALFAVWILQQSDSVPSWAVPGVALAVGSVLLGVVGRAGALALAFVAVFDATLTGLHFANASLLACSIYLLHIGSGRWALWRPEEYYLHAKLGARDGGRS
uniref:CDP-alcohol phosphatidyltransferase family protein n=1 Tax=Caldilinea aerophila TaxID=133453 RepID=A0A7C1FGP8_9CHLR